MKKCYFSMIAFFLAMNISFGQTSLTEAVDFTVTTVHGEEVNLFELLDDGKHVVIDFFFTTCPPCIESVPVVNNAFERYGCNKGDVYFLAIDNGDSNAEVLNYENQYNGLLPSASGNDGGGNEVASTYGIPAYPTLVLIAPDRSIIAQDIYPVTTANIDGAFASAEVPENPDACTAPNGLWDLEASTSKILATTPNPATTYATIDFSIETATTASFQVFNMMGQQVANVPTQAFTAGVNQVVLPLANLANGNYTVHLTTQEGTVDVSKLMILN